MSDELPTFESFLKTCLERHWHETSGDRRGFLALLLAAPEAWQVARQELPKEGLLKPLLAGVLSIATLTTAVRMAVSGPLGLALTGLSAGGLVAAYHDAPEEIRKRASHARALVERYRNEFEDLLRERRRPLREGQWDMMMNALETQFLSELEGGNPYDPATMGGLAEHFAAPSMAPPRPPKR